MKPSAGSMDSGQSKKKAAWESLPKRPKLSTFTHTYGKRQIMCCVTPLQIESAITRGFHGIQTFKFLGRSKIFENNFIF